MEQRTRKDARNGAVRRLAALRARRRAGSTPERHSVPVSPRFDALLTRLWGWTSGELRALAVSAGAPVRYHGSDRGRRYYVVIAEMDRWLTSQPLASGAHAQPVEVPIELPRSRAVERLTMRSRAIR